MSNRRAAAEAPAVSVILAVPESWRGNTRRLTASIDSVLSQTLQNLELIVVDSGAGIAAALAAYDDPRLRFLPDADTKNAASAWNTGFAAATGRHVALLEAGDISLPTRLARQSTYLEQHSNVALLGAVSRPVLGGLPLPSPEPASVPPLLLAWLLLLGLPPATSSLMFRADDARALPIGVAEDFVLGFQLREKLARGGAFTRLDAPLVLRLAQNTAPNETANRLHDAYATILGGSAREAADLVSRHVAGAEPLTDASSLSALSQFFAALTESFGKNTDSATFDLIRSHAVTVWRRVLASAAHAGKIPRRILLSAHPQGIGFTAADGMKMLTEPRESAPPARPVASGPGKLFSTVYEPCRADSADPPSLFVVVDTEAEFDWTKPFSRDLTSVSAMDHIERGQAVFDTYGLRPIYVVDYPVASQPRGYAKLRAILERDGCEIGAHLHPWTTPPFEEALSPENSYPGNLDPALEERKLAVLMQVIRENFGISPVFYKAGRYGFGPATPAALVKHGIRVDLSVLPGADLRRQGGPDFRLLEPVLYRMCGTRILSLPMTRSEVGFLPSLGRLGGAVQNFPGGGFLRLPSVLARLRIADTITLTPEGVTEEEQIRLIRAMLKRGSRQFVLHYHSPSLSPGNTPYARDETGAETLIHRLEHVCQFFFNEIGGIPGYPKDLLRP